ncbi:MBL fold hydrolase [Halobacteriales archaeon QS_4_70_19]|nr:MAG: MBL fold hydrolase [Halobacteriales archaeon QS_4_70_19]
MLVHLREGVWQIECSGVNVYLAAADELTLIDAGTPRDGGTVRTAIREAGFEVADLGRILVTHFDVDHVGALASLAAETGATVHMGAADAPFLMGKEVPPGLTLKGALQRVSGVFVDQPDHDPELVADGDEIGSFVAYQTPGHTPGHTAYVSDDLDAAFVGDLVVERDGELRPSPWFITYDTESVRESIHDLADREPAVDVLGMGHGTPFARSGSVRLAELGERIEAE